jgi:tRNA-splicing ligase RtcB
MPEHLSPKLINWASLLEDGTREQAIRSSTMPFIHPHIALMPDAHYGKGATVGSVIPTVGAIIPAAIGVDAGCGMVAHRTGWAVDQLPVEDLSTLRRMIEAHIPMSAGKYNTNAYDDRTEETIGALEAKAERLQFDPGQYAGNWRLQLGSLGSGNHFIEVTVDQENRVWLFLHSGSRGVGNRITSHHIKVAQDLCKRWYINLPDPDLAYLVEGTDEFWAYIRQLRWAQDFALRNREEMMRRVTDCFEHWLDDNGIGEAAAAIDLEINTHHNYTEQEKHFGKTVWLSRKGAIDASLDTWGLIPGSMGTASYVVRGLGNRLSLNSSPHGAGRNFSRNAARKKFTIADLNAAMEGIEWSGRDAFLDEHPEAYKPIDVVMADAADLVKVKYTLKQILNVKGD